MTENEEKTKEVELDERNILDPNDYSQNEKIRSIYKAKRDVQDTLRGLDPSGVNSNQLPTDWVIMLNTKVAYYVMELEPLIEKSDSISPDRIDFSEGSFCFDSLFEYGARVGRKEDGNPIPFHATMLVYRSCNYIVSDLGLGADLEPTEEGLEL
jgi:hypothetical protein